MDAIPRFSADMALRLVNTTGPEDGFYTVMACHHSPIGEEFSCAGYLAAEGDKNINVRILASRRQIDLRAGAGPPDTYVGNISISYIELLATFWR
jgi:hypothetical protein